MRVQVHIKHVGTAGMLFNPVPLRGIAPKIQKLAVRERRISAINEDPASLSHPGHSLPPPGPGPLQPSALNGAKSGIDSEPASPKPTPYKRVLSKVPTVRDAPRVEIVPGVPSSVEVLFCSYRASRPSCTVATLTASEERFCRSQQIGP